MTVEELLKPRYKVIGRYPNYPFSEGRIVEGVTFNTAGGTKFHYLDYPLVFKSIEWWEERTLDELMSVKYVRITIYTGYWVVGDVVKVTDYKIDTKNKVFEKYVLDTTQSSVPAKCQPATEQEYNDFKSKS